MSLDWDRCRAAVDAMDPVRVSGRIEKIVGLVVEAEGLAASVGALCRIERGGDAVLAEIVGFRGGTAMLMPYGGMEGLARGQKVFLVSERLRVPVGDDLLGRVIDAHGRPLDGGPPLRSMRERTVTAAAPPAMSRRRIERALPTFFF
ncbi:hypothetical protein KDK88_07935, partial [bacterium]|nr:hypothetical protein [bacterium]